LKARERQLVAPSIAFFEEPKVPNDPNPAELNPAELNPAERAHAN
jgi:hypothetical protein